MAYINLKNSHSILFQFYPAILVTFIVFLYSIISFNKYLPLQEGWFQFYHMLMKEGKFPYRDFYIPIQPVFILLTDFICSIFGTSFIVLRWYGVIERIVLILLIFLFLRKRFDEVLVFYSVIIGFFFYGSYCVMLPYSYYQTTLLFSFLSIYFLTESFEKRTKLNIYLTGFWTALAFFTKQSAGLMTLIILIVAFVLLNIQNSNRKDILPGIYSFAAGLFTVGFPILFWLYTGNALSAYCEQVFWSVASKGTPGQILFGFIPRLFDNINIFILSGFCLITYLIFLSHNSKQFLLREITSKRHAIAKINVIFCIFLFMFSFPLFINRTIYGFRFINYDSVVRVVILITFTGLVVLNTSFFIKFLHNRHDQRNSVEFITGLFCIGWMYGHGMSGILEAHSLLPALPYLMVNIYRPELKTANSCKSNDQKRGIGLGDAAGQRFYFRKTMLSLGMASLFVFVMIIASTRYNNPYYWWGWSDQSIKKANLVLNIPALKGLKFTPESGKFYSDSYQVISRNSAPKDDVFFFPHISAVNIITNRIHNNFVPVAYFDVCSDKYAILAAAYVQRTLPKLIIYMDMPESAWIIHENIFRNSNISGQRKIRTVIEDFKKSEQYKVIYSFTGNGNYPVQILKRLN